MSKERSPFRLKEPSGQPELVSSMEEWEREERARRARLGPEVEAAEARTRADYDDQRQVRVQPTIPSGRYEVEAWRRNLRTEAAVDAQDLPESSPEDAPRATESGNRLPMR